MSFNESPPPYDYESDIIKDQPNYQNINDNSKKNSKNKIIKRSRVIIPFPFYDIDITDFPCVKFIRNSITDNKKID